MCIKSDDKVYGAAENPWPYEYVINALLFFAMDSHSLNEYLVEDFPKVLFHGAVADFVSEDALETVFFIYTEILGVGMTIDEWISDEMYMNQGLENYFENLYKQLYEIDKWSIIRNWSVTQEAARDILKRLDWEETSVLPMFTCAEILDEYSYGDYSKTVDGII